MKEYEFYRDESGCFKNSIYDLEDPQLKCFAEFSKKEIHALFDHLCTFQEARRALIILMRFYNNNKQNALRRFIECNWTGLDNKIDITEHRLNYEYIPCMHKGKGTCPFAGEGIVCLFSVVKKKENVFNE